ncbi:hypothetical protein M0R45_005550 [Rubus argutus]|uniref:Uncharacterized protein n=1 Tax=Rubus argutus TaxID=59490 RepID=A0AAW1YNI6_RUBAR
MIENDSDEVMIPSKSPDLQSEKITYDFLREVRTAWQIRGHGHGGEDGQGSNGTAGLVGVGYGGAARAGFGGRVGGAEKHDMDLAGAGDDRRRGLNNTAAAADCNGWALLGMDGIDGGIEKIGLSVDGCERELAVKVRGSNGQRYGDGGVLGEMELGVWFEACPARVMERHFLMVDRLHDEPAIYPPEMQGVEGVHQFASNDAMVFFPQPVSTYANVVNGGHGTHENRDVDGSEQSSPTWTAVSRARNRGTARNYNGRGGIKPTVGNHAPKTNEPVARSVPASPLNAGFGARTKISLRDRQVDDNNIIILLDSIEEDATEIVQNDMADYVNPDAEIDDTSDGFFEDPVVPMNYEEDLEIKIVRKRSRDMFNTDDELDIGSNSVNPTP